MPEPPLEYIEITADHVQAGGKDTPRGTVVRVSDIGEGTARHLIDRKRAKRAGAERGAEAVAARERREAQEVVNG